jgi:hypothetical protein
MPLDVATRAFAHVTNATGYPISLTVGLTFRIAGKR